MRGYPVRKPQAGRNRWHGQRGVTAVEYALGLALLVAVAVTGVQHIANASKAELTRKSGAGAPDLAEVYAESVTTVPTTTTPAAPSTTTTPPYTVRVTVTGAGVNQNAARWIATATVTVVNASTGAAISQATVTGSWAGGGGGAASCITSSNGTCPVTLSGIHKNDASVTLTIAAAAVTGSTGTVLPAPLTIVKPA